MLILLLSTANASPADLVGPGAPFAGCTIDSSIPGGLGFYCDDATVAAVNFPEATAEQALQGADEAVLDLLQEGTYLEARGTQKLLGQLHPWVSIHVIDPASGRQTLQFLLAVPTDRGARLFDCAADGTAEQGMAACRIRVEALSRLGEAEFAPVTVDQPVLLGRTLKLQADCEVKEATPTGAFLECQDSIFAWTTAASGAQAAKDWIDSYAEGARSDGHEPTLVEAPCTVEGTSTTCHKLTFFDGQVSIEHWAGGTSVKGTEMMAACYSSDSSGLSAPVCNGVIVPR